MNNPIILQEGKYLKRDLVLLKKKTVYKTVDIYKNQLSELYKVNNPKLIGTPEFNKTFEDNELKGDWVYFSWNKILVHMINKSNYNLLRTNRNRNLITKEEQKKLLNRSVAMAGLSIGGEIIKVLAYQGIANKMKLADFDTLDTSNLNRLRANIADIGKPKIDILAQEIYEINPYADLFLFNKGLDDSNLIEFFSNPKPDLVIDAIDDFKIKIRLRLQARKLGIPVLMFTNLGDNILIDIERFDKNRKLKLFHGILGDLPEEILDRKEISKEDEQRFAVQIVGMENVPPKAIESVKQIGKTLVGRPQLSSTVTISSGIACFIIRQLLLGENLQSGRECVKINDLAKHSG